MEEVDNGAGGSYCIGYSLLWMEWRPAGWSVFLPLLIFPCTIKSRSSLLAPVHPGGPGKRAVKRLWCVWYVDLRGSVEYCDQRVYVSVCLYACLLTYLKKHLSELQ